MGTALNVRGQNDTFVFEYLPPPPPSLPPSLPLSFHLSPLSLCHFHLIMPALSSCPIWLLIHSLCRSAIGYTNVACTATSASRPQPQPRHRHRAQPQHRPQPRHRHRHRHRHRPGPGTDSGASGRTPDVTVFPHCLSDTVTFSQARPGCRTTTPLSDSIHSILSNTTCRNAVLNDSREHPLRLNIT